MTQACVISVCITDVCIMYVCAMHVCIIYMHHVCFMYGSGMDQICMYHVCFMSQCLHVSFIVMNVSCMCHAYMYHV